MAWLWTDTLAALLAEHDHVPVERLASWVERPIAYRLDDGQDPLTLARRVLLETNGGDGESCAITAAG
jgi:hypothetical protein